MGAGAATEEQRAIQEHLNEWARLYARIQKISRGEIAYPDELAEEAAGLEALIEWDQVFCWLEAHGIQDEDIVYDPATESCKLASSDQQSPYDPK